MMNYSIVKEKRLGQFFYKPPLPLLWKRRGMSYLGKGGMESYLGKGGMERWLREGGTRDDTRSAWCRSDTIAHPR